MNWPQIAIIVLWSLGLFVALDNHGKPKKGTYNFLTALVAGLLEFFILYCGGFFK